MKLLRSVLAWAHDGPCSGRGRQRSTAEEPTVVGGRRLTGAGGFPCSATGGRAVAPGSTPDLADGRAPIMPLSALLLRPLPVVPWRCWLPPRGARFRNARVHWSGVSETKSRGSTTRFADNLGAMNVEVRTITADDWPLFRDVSLRALADSPDAFRRTLAEAQALTEDFWRQQAEGSHRSWWCWKTAAESRWVASSLPRTAPRLRLGHVDGA